MIYIVLLSVISELLFNWLCKETPQNKSNRDKYLILLSAFISAFSLTTLFCRSNSVIISIYLIALAVSNAVKIIGVALKPKKASEDSNPKALASSECSKSQQKEQTEGSIFSGNKNLIMSICLYVDVLFTLVASCFIWKKFAYVILAIVFLMVLIMVHEFGHYIFGKILKFKINEFSIGFGPALFSKIKKNGEKFSIRIIPLGGYCAFDGEDEDKNTEGAFNKQKPWKRLIVLFGGVFFNFVFGVIMSVAYLSVASYGLPQIIAITDGNTNSFMVGDVITEVNGKDFDKYKISTSSFEQFTKRIDKYQEGEDIVLTVLRDGEEIELVVKKEQRGACRFVLRPEDAIQNAYLKTGEDTYLSFASTEQLSEYLKNIDNELSSVYKKQDDGTYVQYDPEELSALCGITESKAGVTLGILQTYHYERYTIGEAFLYAIPFCLDIAWLVLKVLGGLFSGATAVTELGGTVTTIDTIAQVVSIDFKYLLYLVPLISVNLAVFNLLPIPALDGARMVFVLIEWIRRKPINKNVEGYIHLVGLVVLFAFVIFLDIFHFIRF